MYVLHKSINRVFTENLVELGFLQSVSYIKPILTHEKYSLWEKSGPNATFNLIFLWLGWPWVGEFGGFMIIFICFPTQQSLQIAKTLIPNRSRGRHII